MRKHYIDNIRWITILMLFPYHTAMIWNNWGESFYVWDDGSAILSGFIQFIAPVFLSILFTLAGISAKYALEKRTPKQFMIDIFFRLCIPLTAGIILIVPVQTYFAEKFHNGYTGGYLEQFIMFFTKEGDGSGYHSGFTPANLWFLLYLWEYPL